MQEWISRALEGIRTEGLYRFLKTVDSDCGPEVVYQGKNYLNFSSNNYLGLANHPLLKQAAIQATEEFGTGSGASRLITGSMSLHHQLEEKIASFKGVERALLFNSGYHANLGVIPNLVGEGDVIFSDELNHASLIDGCRLSRAKTSVYQHNDVEDLEKLLKNPPPPPFFKGGSLRNGKCPIPPFDKGGQGGFKKLILTDTVFSMDGDLCNLPAIINLAEKQDALVYVDEAHATGVFGKTGRGVVEHFGIDSRHPRLIQMGTLGKALGSFGAYVCGSANLIEYLINKSRTFIYTTALPPAVVAASLAAIDFISKDTSLKERLWENIRYFSNALSLPLWGEGRGEGGQAHAKNSPPHLNPLPKGRGESPIIPLIIGDSKKTMEISEKLFEQGIWATGIRPPTVPEGTARIRLTLMATHTREQLERCVRVLRDVISAPNVVIPASREVLKPGSSIGDSEQGSAKRMGVAPNNGSRLHKITRGRDDRRGGDDKENRNGRTTK